MTRSESEANRLIDAYGNFKNEQAKWLQVLARPANYKPRTAKLGIVARIVALFA